MFVETALVESELQETTLAEITLAVTSLAETTSVETTLAKNLGGNHLCGIHLNRKRISGNHLGENLGKVSYPGSIAKKELIEQYRVSQNLH